MQIIPMRELKNTVEIERRCAEEQGRTVDGETFMKELGAKYGL